MKIKQIAGVCLAVCVLILPLSASGEEQRGKVPPGVQKYSGKGNVEQASFNVYTIYTNDSVKKVINFYRKTLDMEPVSGRRFFLGSDLLNPNSVSEADESIYLWVNSARDMERGTLDTADIFEYLEEEMRMGKMLGKNRHSEQELQQVKEKYAHLVKAWYPDFDVKEKLNTCKNKRRDTIDSIAGNDGHAKQDQKQAGERIQQLMAQGRQQEAMKLALSIGSRGMQTGIAVQNEGVKDYWDFWINCLDEIDAHDFQTKIGIGLFHSYFIPSTEKDRQGIKKKLNF